MWSDSELCVEPRWLRMVMSLVIYDDGVCDDDDVNDDVNTDNDDDDDDDDDVDLSTLYLFLCTDYC